MRLKSKILMAAQNCQAALRDTKMKEDLLVLRTVPCPVPGRPEGSPPPGHNYCQSAALPLQRPLGEQPLGEQARGAAPVVAAVQTP